MRNTDPQIILPHEWREIVAAPDVREAWGITDEETAEDFASTVYGVRFDYCSGGPGYFGDLYILQGDALSNKGPMLLIREKSGQLTVVE